MRPAVVILFLLFSNAIFAQLDARALVVDHIDQLSGAAALSEGQVFYVDSEIISYPRNDLSNPNKLRVVIYLGQDIQYYDAGIVQTLQDKDEVFYVVAAKKTIYRNHVSEVDISADIVKKALMQKELIKSSEITKVEEREIDGNKWLSINFKVHATIAENTDIEDMEFLYNTITKSVGEVKLRFSADNKLALQVMKYNHLDADYKGEKMKAPASAHIFNRGNRLKAAYSGYQLIDLRDSNYE